MSELTAGRLNLDIASGSTGARYAREIRPPSAGKYCPLVLTSIYTIEKPLKMPLCTICTALNPLAGVLDDEEKDAPERERLGLYEELSARADAGCEGCAFFRNIITESTEWKHQLDALPDHVVFLDSLRLDLRPKAKEDGFTYCLDDLKFDICSAGGVVGKSIGENSGCAY